ncbi:MAG: translesion DNA synthesis-associated protein ImuA [Pseudomonadota bacterium]
MVSDQPRLKIGQLLQKTGMWRASRLDYDWQKGIATGFARLDRELAGSGWPADGLTELLHDQPGIGEFRLLAPALAQLSQTQARWILMISPPYLPYAPALAGAGIDLSRVLVVEPNTRADMLWVLEKAIGSRSCSAVLAWPRGIREKEIRRLQVASKEGQCTSILFRPGRDARQSSPAELRLQIFATTASSMSDHTRLEIRILKRRGGWATSSFCISFEDNLNLATPDYSEITVERPQPPELPTPVNRNRRKEIICDLKLS